VKTLLVIPIPMVIRMAVKNWTAFPLAITTDCLNLGRTLRPFWLMPQARDEDKPQQLLLDIVTTNVDFVTLCGAS
jgi:hypothetical protein